MAVLTQTINTGTVAVNYLHRDHLGSVETITNEAGIVTQRMSFDAWGKRREVNWQPMGEEAIATFNTDTTTRGFTGHEQIDSVGLIHMNGRVYDAELGRFLSADPHIQALDNLQNFNRYSYVLNNPLSYTDPTGFFFSKLFKAIGKAFGKLFKAIGRAFKKLLRSPIFRAIIQVVACTFGGPAGCAVAQGVMTAASGGSIGDAFKAMAFAFVSGIAGSVVEGANVVVQTIVKGAISGAMSVAQGGNFLAGFAAGAIGAVGKVMGAAASSFGRVVISAITGCASAVVSGGKCANGAVTAAFSAMLGEARRQRREFRKWEPKLTLKSKLSDMDKVAIKALDIANPLSIRDNIEYGGLIYLHPNGTLSFTIPKPGTSTSVDLGMKEIVDQLPEGAIIYGDYHTHADYSYKDTKTGAIVRTTRQNDSFSSDYFSNGDIESTLITSFGKPYYRSYLGTPSGAYQVFNPHVTSGNFEFYIKK